MPITRSSFGRLTSGLRLVSRSSSHFHTGRRFLLAEGVLLIALGVAGFVSAATHSNTPPTGAPVLMLALTPWHSAILLGFGALAVLGTLQRRAAITVTAFGAAVFAALVIIGAVSAVHHAPGPLGFEARDIVLHGVLAAANFAVLYWLIPDVLEGPDWVPRPGTQTEQLKKPTTGSPIPFPVVHEGFEAPTVPAAGDVTAGDDTAGTDMLIGTVDRVESPPTYPIASDSYRRKSTMTAPRNVVVTGASAGIGRAVAREFGARGDNVTLLARGQGGLDGAVKDVEAAGGQALTIATDVAEYDEVDAAATQSEEAFGPIDVWVNVAFTSVFAPFHQITAEEYRRVTDVSYLGYVHGTMVALSRMRPRNAGTIVQVGSALGSRAIPLQSAYCGAKHAINGFTESVRTELMHEHSDINITVVQMPAVNTPQFSWVLSRLPKHPQPVPPIYQPEVAARAVLFAAEHPRRKQYWVGASTAVTTLGQKFAPALLDRYLAKTGYASQQTKESVSPNRPNNLWEPLDDESGDDYGAHGAFDGRSLRWSPQLWASQHAGSASIAAAGGAVAVGAATLMRLRRR